MDMTFLEVLATTASGLLAGALVTEACILVPYWKTMNPEDFLLLHPTMAPLLFRFYAPLTIAGTVLPVVVCAAHWALNPTALWQWTLSAVCGIALIGFYFGFFREANRRFEEGASAVEASVTLSKWAKMHQARTIVAVLSFVLAALGLSAS